MRHHINDWLHVRPTAVIVIPEYFYDKPPSRSREKQVQKAKKLKNHRSHILTLQASRRLKYSINILIDQAQWKKAFNPLTKSEFDFKVNFITLTLPCKQVFRACELLHSKSEHSDQSLHRDCLMRFMEECKRRWNVHAYVWRSESQEKGNIHYHITTDTFIPYDKLQIVWNKIIARKGYIDQYRANQLSFHSSGFVFRPELANKEYCNKMGYGKTWDYESQVNAYNYGMATNWQNPPTTQVKSVNNINDLAAYMVKYMAKELVGRRPIMAKQWGCSSNIAPSKKCIVDGWDCEYEELTKLYEGTKAKQIISDYFTIIPLNKRQRNSLLPKALSEAYRVFINSIQADYG